MTATTVVDDALWDAVGDPTRRALLDLLLVDGSGTATSLSASLPVTRQAVAKHLAVLDRAGLVRGTAAGREHRYHVDRAQLARAAAQLAAVGASWDGRLRRIARIAEDLERGRRADRPTAPHPSPPASPSPSPSPSARRTTP